MAGGSGLGEQGGGQGGCCPGMIYSIMWILVLIILAWPLSIFLAVLYIILLPFTACIKPLKEVCDPLLRAVQFPLRCSENCIRMAPMC